MVGELEQGVALCEWPHDGPIHFCLHRFPAQAVLKLPPDSLEPEVLTYLQPDLDLSGLAEGSYGFQLRASERLPWSLGELATGWREYWDLPEKGWNPRSPQKVVSAYLHLAEATLYLGVSSVEENLSPWAGGACRIPRDKKSVSRAEQKLLEALELIPELSCSPRKKRALDLGAAPGGWSRVAATLGYQVDAIDPADLDPAVEALAQVTHYQTTSGDFLSHSGGSYDLILCDMKMEAKVAGRFLSKLVPRLKQDGYLITTLKLPKTGDRLKACRRGLNQIKKAFTIVKARQLFFNRSEITVIAKGLATPRATKP